MLPPLINYFLFRHYTLPSVIFNQTFCVGPILFTLHYVMRDGSFLTCTRAGSLLTSDSPLQFTDSGLELPTKIVSLSNASAYWCAHLCYCVYQL